MDKLITTHLQGKNAIPRSYLMGKGACAVYKEKCRDPIDHIGSNTLNTLETHLQGKNAIPRSYLMGKGASTVCRENAESNTLETHKFISASFIMSKL